MRSDILIYKIGSKCQVHRDFLRIKCNNGNKNAWKTLRNCSHMWHTDGMTLELVPERQQGVLVSINCGCTVYWGNASLQPAAWVHPILRMKAGRAPRVIHFTSSIGQACIRLTCGWLNGSNGIIWQQGINDSFSKCSHWLQAQFYSYLLRKDTEQK